MEVQDVLFYGFIFFVGVCLYIPAFLVRNRLYVTSFTMLSAMVFTFLAFQLSEYTILLLVFIGIVLIQFLSLLASGRGQKE